MGGDRGRSGTGTSVDLDVHGVVGLRLIDPSPADVVTVTRQLGAVEAPVERPDVVIRFVDRVRLPADVRYIGLDDAAFGDGRFYLFGGRGRARVATRVDLAGVGHVCELECRSGTGRVPLLVSIVNVTALAKGWVPLHASAFHFEGRGVLVAGWTKGGKTETLLAFMANGASYVGDEWVYLAADGTRMLGLGQPITLWDWHLSDLPQYRAALGRGQRSRLRAGGVLQRLLAVAPGRLLRSRIVDRLLGMAQGQLGAQIDPSALFGAEACRAEAPLDVVLFPVSHAARDVRATPADAAGIARRMAFSVRTERADLASAYLKFRFAFPDARSEVIDRADRLEADALEAALAGKPAWRIGHPYPAPIPALFETIAPRLRR